jgi:hypothetical protein
MPSRDPDQAAARRRFGAKAAAKKRRAAKQEATRRQQTKGMTRSFCGNEHVSTDRLTFARQFPLAAPVGSVEAIAS